MIQVRYVKTVVGWFNVYLGASSRFVNLSPQQFRQYFPTVSPNVRLGCAEVDAAMAEAMGL